MILIKVPSLNERKEDIPELVEKFLTDIAAEHGTKTKKVDSKGMKELQNQNWTGNIRELRNVVERLVIMSNDTIGGDDVKKYL